MQITDNEFARLFPFFFRFDAEGWINATGPSLERYINNPGKDVRLFEQFLIKSPHITNIEDIKATTDQIVLLAIKNKSDLVLRGQFLQLHNELDTLFVGVPWVTDLTNLSELGLSLDDYSLYEPTTYFLLLNEAQRSSLAESQSIQQQLQKLNQSLTKRVERRTARLSQINRELIASQEKLQKEMAQRQEMEMELRIAQKMEALGLLSAGIAHEINTPIQFVGDSLSFIEDSVRDLQNAIAALEDLIDTNDAKKQTTLEHIQRNFELSFLKSHIPESIRRAQSGIEQVSSIIKSMKAFTHTETTEKNYWDINEGLRNTLIVTKNQYKSCAVIDLQLQDLPAIYCNLSDLNQVFLNLIINAVHAIEQKFSQNPKTDVLPGKITVVTKALKEEILVAISDNGCGIDKTIMDKIFDPFFTTKAVEKGSGQGLSLCHRIVYKGHRGRIKVSSEPNVGTEFKIYLPLTTVDTPEESLHE